MTQEKGASARLRKSRAKLIKPSPWHDAKRSTTSTPLVRYLTPVAAGLAQLQDSTFQSAPVLTSTKAV